MVSQFSEIQNFDIPLPITDENFQVACQFAARQPTREKAEQVLLNTLAVSIVNNYLNMLDIATDLSSSDSWNPVMQVCSNVSDLDIPGVGKLECRPIKISASSCRIPLEVWDLRIGYLVIQIDNSFKQAAILGFTPEVTTEDLKITDLRPPEELLDRLHELQNSAIDNSFVNLGQWLNNIFETGWQTVESLLNPEQLTPALGFRNTELLEATESEMNAIDNRVRMVKLINLGLQFGDRNLILLVEISPEENGNIAVTLQVHPNFSDLYLPEGLELKVLESSDEVFLQVQARKRDNFIQLQFSGQPEEIFRVEIILAEIVFSEKFKL
jgi:hypothetical protein